MSAPHPLDAPVAEAARRVRDRRDPLTALALVEESLRRIERWNGPLNAFLHVSSDLARAQARAVDARVERGEDPGALAGIPLAVKDNLAVAGLPLTCASKILAGYRPPEDATVIQRAVAAGACIVGKTNLDEFAMGSSTENSAFGPTRNPYDLERVAGGSSGGSAAAVACGAVPLALGSDTGGSIRQPAALCGIVGVKPTYGRVSRSGLVAFASSLDQVGPLARTVEDAALLLSVIAGPDPLDATTRRFAAPPTAPVPRRPETLRIGLVKEFDLGSRGDPAVSAMHRQVVARMVAAGATTREVSVPLGGEAAIPIYYIVAPAEASSNLARFDGVRYGYRAPCDDLAQLYARTRGQGFGPEVRRRILVGTFVLSAGYADAYYRRALAARHVLERQFAAAFEQTDVLLSATTPTPAFRVGEKSGDPVQMYLCDVLTVLANLAGIPALSLPAGMSADGLPIGVQLWAPHGRDDLLLAAAQAVASTLGTGYVAPPAPPSERRS